MSPSANKPVLLFCLLLICHTGPVHAEKADRNKPIHIESDRVSVDDAKHISTFEGKVEFTQGTLQLNAEKVVVSEDAAGNKLCVATGQLASFRQKREDTEEYVEGFGERIEYDTRSGTVDFYEHARVKREQDEVRGDHITYSTKTEIFRVSGQPETGRVRATIQPKNKDAQTTSTKASGARSAPK